MRISPDQLVQQYVADIGDDAMNLDRLVTEPCGLDAAGMIEALLDPRLGQLGITFMADSMAVDGSIYFDAIFGAYYGQAAVRAWLVPAMAEIAFIEFVPLAEPLLFDDGEGGTSLDEWFMVAVIGDDRIPLSRGVSVRRYRDGWITWACDVYDTGPFRQPPPPELAIEAAPLPSWPRVEWITDQSVVPAPLSTAAREWVASRRTPESPRAAAEPSGLSHADLVAITNHHDTATDFDLFSDMCHPTDSVYIDPLFGEFRGQAAIRTWITDVMAKVGDFAHEALGPLLFDGTTSVQEWKQMAIQPDGTRVMVMRGTSVRKFADGWLVYAADYFDTAPLGDAEIVAASHAAGSTITGADMAKHRAAGGL